MKSLRICYNKLELHLFVFLKLFCFTATTKIYSFEVFVGNRTIVRYAGYADLPENFLLLIYMKLLSKGFLILGLPPTNPFKLDMVQPKRKKKNSLQST